MTRECENLWPGMVKIDGLSFHRLLAPNGREGFNVITGRGQEEQLDTLTVVEDYCQPRRANCRKIQYHTLLKLSYHICVLCSVLLLELITKTILCEKEANII